MLKIGEEMMNIDNEINKHLNIYEIAQAVENVIIYEINIRFDNDCLDNKQIDAMLSIATGLIY